MYKYLEINNTYVNIFLSSIANLKCTPSNRQMYPRLGTPVLEVSVAHADEIYQSFFYPKIRQVWQYEICWDFQPMVFYF